MLLCCCYTIAMFMTFTVGLLCTLAAIVTKAYALGGGSSSKKVLLKNVKSLTLRKDKVTSHRRVSAVPQLKCIGGAGCRYYQVEVMRCENAGSDYDEDSIQWTCKATVPEEFKLGSTDVRCEGYRNSQDQFILKGSCGVEYRLLLTDKGMEKYGASDKGFDLGSDGTTGRLFTWLFWLAFFGVVFVMIRSAWRNMRDNARRPGQPGIDTRRPPRPPFDGGDGGGGGPWFGGDGDDSPPPYSPLPKPSSQAAAGQQQPWRLGFWSGAAAGAAATYLGNRGNRTSQAYDQSASNRSSSRNNRPNTRSWSGNGEGSSSSSSYTNFRSSTGFGSTSNR